MTRCRCVSISASNALERFASRLVDRAELLVQLTCHLAMPSSTIDTYDVDASR